MKTVSHRYNISGYYEVEKLHEQDIREEMMRIIESTHHLHQHPIGCGWKHCKFCGETKEDK